MTTLTVQLPEDEARRLAERAAREGKTPEEAAQAVLGEYARGDRGETAERGTTVEFRDGIEYRDGKRYFAVKASFRGDGSSVLDSEDERMEGFGRD